MPGGDKNISGIDNTNGFQKNPQNINRKGRPPSIRKQIRELLGQSGEITIAKEQVITKHRDGSVTIMVPNDLKVAMKLEQWAMSSKEKASLGAIKIMVEQTDGKPDQTSNVNLDHGLDLTNLTLDERKEYLRLIRKCQNPAEEAGSETEESTIQKH